MTDAFAMLRWRLQEEEMDTQRGTVYHSTPLLLGNCGGRFNVKQSETTRPTALWPPLFRDQAPYIRIRLYPTDRFHVLRLVLCSANRTPSREWTGAIENFDRKFSPFLSHRATSSSFWSSFSSFSSRKERKGGNLHHPLHSLVLAERFSVLQECRVECFSLNE